MRNTVREFLEYSEAEKQELWKKATFVFDTYVLLNLYRYSMKTREALLSAMDELKGRIWMPYQVAQEFMKRRPGIIHESFVRYDDLEDISLSPFREKLRVNKDDPEFQKLQEYINQWINQYKEKNLTVTDSTDDSILERLFVLFDGRVGSPYSDEKLEEIKKEGESRYKQKVPPGYKDGTKIKDNNDNNAYGDLIVWKQIIEYASKEKADIIFVTDDQKEDWWNKLYGKTIGPRIELRKEFFSLAQTQFHMYTMESFISHSLPASVEPVDDSVIEEVKAYAAPVLEGLGAVKQRLQLLPHALNADGIDIISALENEITVLELKNERRRSDLEGIYERYADKPVPAKVMNMVTNLRRNIRSDQMRIAAMKSKRNKLVHGLE